jgi:hypothetical protein
MELFYRVYHIDAKGGTAALYNFRAIDDAFACERASEIMAHSEWPGIELWESGRQVHSKGVIRLEAGISEFPPQKLAAAQIARESDLQT